MVDRRKKQKGRRSANSFLAMPHAVLNHPNFTGLSPRATKLLMDLASQYKGSNNGDLAAAWSIMSKRGWTSKDQLHKALQELLRRGWVVITRQGHRPRVASLYALTWLEIHECGGKLDRAPTRKALGYWKAGVNPELVKTDRDPRRAGQVTPPHGSMEPELDSHRPATRVDVRENNIIPWPATRGPS